jgi:acetyl-CoA C-acetyltransferase
MKVKIIGIGMTKFGEHWQKSLADLAEEAGIKAMQDAGLNLKDLDAIFVGNMLSASVTGQEHLGALVAERLNLKIPAIRIEGACASGGMAVHQACLAIASGHYQRILVIGVEKMTDLSTQEVNQALMGASAEAEEGVNGFTFASLYALMAKAYMEKYGLKEEELAQVSVKNHAHASLNPLAQFPFKVSLKQVLESPMVADPLKVLDCSPITDGAAAVVLSRRPLTVDNGQIPVSIIGSSLVSDTLSLAARREIIEQEATKMAVQEALKMAGIKLEEIDLAEVHDCFTIAEIISLESLGFFKKGEAGKATVRGETSLYGRLPVNTSGGLKACGHPVGATGVKQMVELVLQLRGQAGKRQVKKARIGLAQNIGGSGSTAVIHILKKGDHA